MRILCCIVVYNPNMVTLLENIRSLINDVSRVLIWQNSELKRDEINTIKSCFGNDKLIIVGNGTNNGIPKALNYAISQMRELACDYLLTMDQDSIWVNFHQFKLYVESCPKHLIYGPEIIANTDLQRYSSRVEQLSIVENGYVITSGMLCHEKVFSRVGLFNEELFIDAVDEEYCYRARQKGIKSVQIQGAYLRQQFGESKVVSFAGKKTIVSNYSAFRYYYIVRNHIYLLRTKLPSKAERKSIIINYVRAPIFKCILFESGKIKKLWAISRGIYAGMRIKLPEE